MVSGNVYPEANRPVIVNGNEYFGTKRRLGAGGQTGGGTAKPTPKPDDEEDPNDRPDII